MQKDKIGSDDTKKRINVRKILSLNDVIKEPYSKVTIELKENVKLNEIKEILSATGNTEINLVIIKKNQKAYYSLENNRKFDLNHFNHLKTKEYVIKITV